MPEFDAIIAIPNPEFFVKFRGIGGHMAHLIGITSALKKHGYKVGILSYKCPWDEMNISNEMDKFHFPSNICFRQIWNLLFFKQIIKQVKKIKPRFLYVRYAAQFSPWIKFLKIKLMAVPLIIELNSSFSQKYPLLSPIEKFFLKQSDLTICVSNCQCEFFHRKFGSATCRNFVVIPNGVDLDRFEVQNQIEILPHNCIHLGFVGTLKYSNGLNELLYVGYLLKIKKIPAILHIVGNGPGSRIFGNLGLDYSNIRFHGPISFEKIPTFLKSLDILIYTTTNENSFQSPIKVFEYMAAAKPIIAMRTPQTEIIIKDKHSGILVPIGSPNAIISAIETLIECPSLGQTLAKNAAVAAKSHSWTSRVKDLLSTMQTKGLLN